MKEFRTYRQFFEEGSAKEVGQTLLENGIEYSITQEKESLDTLYGDNQHKSQFNLNIGSADFLKADEVLSKLSEKEIDNIDKSHYLFQFSDDELFEVVAKSDEWNQLDVQLAKRILKDRGKTVTDETIQLLRNHRIAELKKPEQSAKAWIYAGYILALLGGLIGILFGYSLMTAKKVLPNGSKVYTYTASDRKQGTYIFFLGIFMFIAWILIRLI